MENKVDIIEGSKKIAEFMGLKYSPFNDLQGFPKPGWWEVHSKEPKIEEVKVHKPTVYEMTKGNKGEVCEIVTMDTNKLKYTRKNGYVSTPEYYTKFVCRNHADLRYYNDTDLLLTVLDKIGGTLQVKGRMVFLTKDLKTFYAPYEKNVDLRKAIFNVILEYLHE